MANKSKPKAQKNTNRVADGITIKSGQRKTFQLTLDFKSDMMNEYLVESTRNIIIAIERLAELFRFTMDTPDVYSKVKEWSDSSMNISRAQLEALIAQREEIQSKQEVELVEYIAPTDFSVKFEFSHSIGRKFYNLMRSVDDELNSIEAMYLSGVIDDLEYASAKRQALSILRGYIDRIYKATSPGKRTVNGKISFKARAFVEMLKKGHKIDEGVDKPLEFQKSENAA